MARRRSTVGRSEIDQRIRENQEAATAQEEEFEEAVLDSEVVDETRDSLDLGGTDEGADETDQYLAEAQDHAADIAEDRDEQLDQIHDEGKETEAELDERVESNESDQERIAQAEHSITVKETLERVERSLETIREDIAFLEDANERSSRAWEELEQRQQDLRARIRRGG